MLTSVFLLKTPLLSFIGTNYLYWGNDNIGNKLIFYALNHKKEATYIDYYNMSILNTKNGNFDISIKLLDTAYSLNKHEIGPYYGWVLLYYFHNFEKSLKILEELDRSTPNFSDAPMGEDIHYLKGLAFMNLEKYNSAIKEFDINISESKDKYGEKWVNVYSYINKGNCLKKKYKYKQAVSVYQSAINLQKDCTEGFYFMAISQLKYGEIDSACINLEKSKKLLLNGMKSSDMYVELFHEIYLSQITDTIVCYCNN